MLLTLLDIGKGYRRNNGSDSRRPRPIALESVCRISRRHCERTLLGECSPCSKRLTSPRFNDDHEFGHVGSGESILEGRVTQRCLVGCVEALTLHYEGPHKTLLLYIALDQFWFSFLSSLALHFQLRVKRARYQYF